MEFHTGYTPSIHSSADGGSITESHIDVVEGCFDTPSRDVSRDVGRGPFDERLDETSGYLVSPQSCPGREPWSESHSSNLMEYKVKCLSRASVHLSHRNEFINLNRYIGYPLALITSGMGPINLIFEDSKGLPYINAGAYFVIGGLFAALTTYDFSDLAEKHRFAYAEYTRLAEKINFQLHKESRYRKHVSEFSFEVRHTYSSLIRTSPVINVGEE